MRWQTLRDDGGAPAAVVKSTSPLRWARKEATEDIIEVSSSGSSTSDEAPTPSRKVTESNEVTPLLSSPRELETRRTLLAGARALLVYQPRPFPVFNKLLPSNGTSIVVLAFLGLNLFYCSYNMEFTGANIFVLADRWGLMFVANLPLLYLLAAKNQPLKFLTGRSYESLNIFHRRLGELLCFQALIHALAMTGTWYFFIRPTGRLDFTQYILLPVIYFGLGAFFAYEILYLTSLGSFRQRFYEIFLGLHVVLQALALIFVYFHHPVGQIYVGVALFIFLSDRLIFRLFVKSTTMTTSAKILEDGETVKLSTTFDINQGAKSILSGWDPTDHVFVTATALGKNHTLMAHPFTIASSAPTSSSTSATLELLIRAQAGFSRDLLNYVHRHNSLSLRLDGPYGSSHARHLLENSNVAVLIAGGSGIAVAWPLIMHLIHLASSDVELPTRSKQQVVLIWVIHQDTHVSWLSSSQIAAARAKGVEIIIPKPTEEAGRPDLKSMIVDVVDQYDTTGQARIGVVASGPDGMNRTVRNTCAEIVWHGRDVGVTIEKFGW